MGFLAALARGSAALPSFLLFFLFLPSLPNTDDVLKESLVKVCDPLREPEESLKDDKVDVGATYVHTYLRVAELA